MSRPHIRLWTDGSCSSRGQRIGGWAFVGEVDGAAVIEMGGRDRPLTINACELLAVIRAIRWQKQHYPGHPVTVMTDSKYVVRNLRGERYDPDGDHRQLRLYWRQLDRVLGTDVRPTIEWVKGHSDLPFNDRADYLAKQAQGGGAIFREPSPRK